MINEVREKFLKEYEENPHLYDSEDIEKIKQNDFYVRRYINYQNQGPEKGLKHMIKSYRWRKKFDVNNFDQFSVPREIYQMGAVVIYPPDKEGDLMMYIRGKMHRKVDIIEERIKHFFAYQVNQLDEKVGREHGFSLLIDATGSGYENADLGLLLFVFETLRTAFPNGIKYFIIYGLPWILNAFASFALSFLPSNALSKVRFFDKKQLFEFVDEENLPDFLGGKCKKPYRRVPRGAKDIYTLAALEGLSREETDKLLKPSLKYIENENFIYVDHFFHD
ncbi:Motile sperm domain-containing protein 2-like protein [Dinothrombium tinctorium]|uniref:Motile sperm domain-containing protein 2-like protein n=1 Tax=Dinothrombium tinctorium TaxID=1965070 RepID=A0A3S3PJ54_9ACAR|nr:Motile sperm domain-containing protein 2-like protein [Dinothrombium tinctorium]RWS03414.1 Motile sperm domain-containing protein 2-like protein [Dinothrombium tinctorium]RWS16262.1 Motile sperm domain-containing protein 2-like protein [Dinothrombium tinctorium]